MLYTICSAERQAVISTTGAELQSLTDRTGGEEFIWQGDPAIWSGRAPVLFPIVGGLKNNTYCHGQQNYAMEQHGFVRKSEFECVEASQEHLRLNLRASAATLEQYPWDFSFQVDFFWRDDQLVIEYTISNLSGTTMLFNVGSHPAFCLPLDDAQIGDYSIAFSEPETLDTWSIVDRLLEASPTRFLTDQKTFDLSPNLFDNDALVFMNIRSTHVSLGHRHSGTRVSVDTGGAPHLGIWAKPAAPYVCIEPWWGYADFVTADGVLKNKADVQTLPVGAVFRTHIGVATSTPPAV